VDMIMHQHRKDQGKANILFAVSAFSCKVTMLYGFITIHLYLIC